MSFVRESLCGGDKQTNGNKFLRETGPGDLSHSLTVHPNAVLHLAEGVLRNAAIRSDVLRLEVANRDRHPSLVGTLRDVLHDLLERGAENLT